MNWHLDIVSLSAFHASWQTSLWAPRWVAMCDDTTDEQSQWWPGDCSWAEAPRLKPLPWDSTAQPGRSWSVATLFEEEAILVSLSSWDIIHTSGAWRSNAEDFRHYAEHKENFLLLMVEPYSHTLPWLRKANWPQLRGKPDRGTEEQNPSEEDLWWRKTAHGSQAFTVAANFSAHICPSKRDSLATQKAPSGFFSICHSFSTQRFVARSFHGITWPAPSSLDLSV